MKIHSDHSTSNLLPHCGLVAAVVITLATSLNAIAGDWLMWRYDAGRTATSPGNTARQSHTAVDA